MAVEDKVCLYAIEELDIFRELYPVIFTVRSPVKLLGVSAAYDLLAMEAIRSCSPDVVLLGIRVLDASAIGKANKIHQSYPRTPVLILCSSYSDRDISLLKTFVMNHKGGAAVFNRQTLESIKHLIEIITSVARRIVLLDPSITDLLLDGNRNPVFQELTRREMEIVNLICSGHTNRAIAETLCIDVKTVRHHINNIYSKIQAKAIPQNMHPRVSLTRLYLEGLERDRSRGAPR